MISKIFITMLLILLLGANSIYFTGTELFYVAVTIILPWFITKNYPAFTIGVIIISSLAGAYSFLNTVDNVKARMAAEEKEFSKRCICVDVKKWKAAGFKSTSACIAKNEKECQTDWINIFRFGKYGSGAMFKLAI